MAKINQETNKYGTFLNSTWVSIGFSRLRLDLYYNKGEFFVLNGNSLMKIEALVYTKTHKELCFFGVELSSNYFKSYVDDDWYKIFITNILEYLNILHEDRIILDQNQLLKLQLFLKIKDMDEINDYFSIHS